MTCKLVILIITCVMLGALAQLAMKVGMSDAPMKATMAKEFGGDLIVTVLKKPLVIGGLAAYVLGAGLWLFVLSQADLSLVYPFTGLGFVLTMLFGWLFLHENVGMYRIVGTLLIATGAYFVAKS